MGEEESNCMQANKETCSLDNKVKLLKKEFKDMPPFLIRRVLNRVDINGDVDIARKQLKEMQSGNNPGQNHGTNQNRRGGRGQRGCQGRSQSSDTASEGNSTGHNLNQSQSCNDIPSLLSNMNINQSQAENFGNQSQTRRNRNRRSGNRNRNQNNSNQPHFGGGGNQQWNNFMQMPQNYYTRPQFYGQQYAGFQQHGWVPNYQLPMPPYAPINPQNQGFVDGFPQRNHARPAQQNQRHHQNIPKTQQPLEPNTIVLHGLKTKVSFDNVRNFIEARTQEQVMDIAFSDDGTSALITLKKLSGKKTN